MAALSSAKFDPPLGQRPVLQNLRPDQLQIDPAYQRGMEDKRSTALVSRIARAWNWELCQPLVVAQRRDRSGGNCAALFVIDGQHRLAAARLRGDITDLPCVVVEFASQAAEAASFVAINQERKPLTRLDLFRAAAASGGARPLAIHAALTEAGLSLAPHTNPAVWKPAMVSNIGGIERTWTRDGPEVAARALAALAQGFEGAVLTHCGTLYRPIARVCRQEMKGGTQFRGERFAALVALLQSRTQQQWVDRFNRYFTDHPEQFRGESCDQCLSEDWRGVWAAAATSARADPARSERNGGALAAKPAGFGLGAGDFEGDEEWAWCRQCDARRTRSQARGCVSSYCPLRGSS